MTEEAVQQVAPNNDLAGGQPESNSVVNGGAVDSSSDTTPTEAFVIPEAYKDKAWVSKIKTTDDLWKQLENAQGLIGKKAIAPDFEKATPEEIEKYYDQLRPQDKSAYKLDDLVPEDQKAAYSDLLHKHGISAKQGSDLVKDYMAMQNSMLESMTSEDGFNAELEKSFGKNFKQVGGSAAKTIAASLSPGDKALVDNMPNQYLGVLYRLAANLNTKYGATETSLAAENSQQSMASFEQQAAALRQEIFNIDKRSHTHAEKSALIQKLNQLYENKMKSGA